MEQCFEIGLEDAGVRGYRFGARLTLFGNIFQRRGAIGGAGLRSWNQPGGTLLLAQLALLVFFFLCACLIASRPGRRLGLLMVAVLLGVYRNRAGAGNPPATA